MQPQQTLWLRRSISWRRNSWKVPGSAWKSPPRFSRKSTMASYMDDWKISKFKWWILFFTAKHIGGCFRGSLFKRGWIFVGAIFLNKNFPYPTTQVLVFRDRCVFGKQHLGHAEKSPKSPGSRPKDSPAGALEKMLHVTEAGMPDAFPGDTKIGIPHPKPPGDIFFGGEDRGPTKWAFMNSNFCWSVFDDDFSKLRPLHGSLVAPQVIFADGCRTSWLLCAAPFTSCKRRECPAVALWR